MSKVQIRQGVFETNSSSTHSITMVDKSEYDAWVKGEILFNQDTEKFLPVDEAIEENIKFIKEYNSDCEESAFNQFAELYRTTKSISDALAGTEEELTFDEEYLDWYELYVDYNEYADYVCENYETYTESYKTKSGDEIVAFGYYGNDY